MVYRSNRFEVYRFDGFARLARSKAFRFALFLGAVGALCSLSVSPVSAQTAPTALSGTPAEAQAVNDNGLIAGRYTAPTTTGPGAYWSSYTATPFSIPRLGSGRFTRRFDYCVAVNSSGDILGKTASSINEPDGSPGAVFSTATNTWGILASLATDEYNNYFGYGLLSSGSDSISYPTDLSDNGTKVGYAVNGLTDRAWYQLSSSSTPKALISLDQPMAFDDASHARGISSKGDGNEFIVGGSAHGTSRQFTAIYWTWNATTSEYNAPVSLGGGTPSTANAISPNATYIVGYSGGAAEGDAVYWVYNSTTGTYGSMQTLTATGSGYAYRPTRVNNNGVVIGYRISGSNVEPCAWRIGGTSNPILLNAALPPSSGWTLTKVGGIKNDSSATFVGTGTYSGQTTAFQWTVP